MLRRARGPSPRLGKVLLLGLAVAGANVRIAYVTNTWWPKVDGAAITVMGHAHFFANAGHPVLVVRPEYPADSPVLRRAVQAGMESDPVPPSDRLTFLSYRMSGTRGGGFEPEMDASDLARVEAGLAAWKPDVVLVVDPDYFVLDTFRVPGLNSLLRLAKPPTMIACMTTFCIEAIRKMPEYWWLNYAPVHQLFLQGLATAYGQFDHIFVNGEQSAKYLQPLRVSLAAPSRTGKGRRLPLTHCCQVVAPMLRTDCPARWLHGWANFEAPSAVCLAITLAKLCLQVLRNFRWEPLPPARVVRSRGVPVDFCSSVSDSKCESSPSVALMRQRPPGTTAFIYVGRLAYDKSVDELLTAFERAKSRGQTANSVLYLAGSGELEALIARHAARIPALRGGAADGDFAQLRPAKEGKGAADSREEKQRVGVNRNSPSIVHLGQVSHDHVSCVLREADVYVSAAHNETYGRSLVEALRCGLPIVTMSSCNMHVTHQHNGLLGDDAVDLERHIRIISDDAELRDRLKSGALAYDGATDGSTDFDGGLAPNQAMLRAILEAHSSTCGGDAVHCTPSGQRIRAWHPFWSIWMALSTLLDAPILSATIVATVSICVVTFIFLCLGLASPAGRDAKEHEE
mmetsp:Transcript_4832/g.15465  ORF Transcript_4832/g.15465 Transcript_4832/m.15465 type:complete len:628 (-) Transcript_4832:465-2348(-)